MRAEGIPSGRYDIRVESPKSHKIGTLATVSVGFPETLIVLNCESWKRIERYGPNVGVPSTDGKVIGVANQQGPLWIRVVPLFSARSNTQIAEVRSNGSFTLFQVEEGRHLAIVLKDDIIIGTKEFNVVTATFDKILIDLSKQPARK